MTQSSPELAAAHWYGQPGVIRHWFHGVFEGGGAKGIAYSGALLAMAERACWFRAVAGASVGAITAALVASGLTPNEIEAQTDHALKLFPTSRWAGLRRLQRSTGYFSSGDLRNWLPTLTTLSFEIPPQVRETAIASARQKTLEHLKGLGIVLPGIQAVTAGMVTGTAMPEVG